jgi:hypothetical protein
MAHDKNSYQANQDVIAGARAIRSNPAGRSRRVDELPRVEIHLSRVRRIEPLVLRRGAPPRNGRERPQSPQARFDHKIAVKRYRPVSKFG